jgi:hypothetical protein
MTTHGTADAFAIIANSIRRNLTPDQVRGFIEALRDTEAYAGNPPIFEVFIGLLLKPREGE